MNGGETRSPLHLWGDRRCTTRVLVWAQACRHTVGHWRRHSSEPCRPEHHQRQLHELGVPFTLEGDQLRLTREGG